MGRSEELAAFDEALSQAARGEPIVVLVAGESGVGKSRLVAEFGERARSSGARVLRGDCVEMGEGELPYGPLVGALRSLDPEELAELAGPGRAELALLLPEAEESREEPRDEQFAQLRMFHLLLSLLGRLGEGGPLVLVIEDLHWADSSTRDFLAFLVRALRQERLLLVGTYRSDEVHTTHLLRPLIAELRGLADRFDLKPFSRPELVAQLTGILGNAPDAELVDTLYERSEGNAFFAEELLAAGGRSGVLPATLRDALMVRVEALSDPTQELLRLAAAAGRDVTHRSLLATYESAELVLLSSLREAVAHQVLVQRHAHSGYAFRHALMREAIYQDLLPGERRKLHVSFAEALSGDPSLSAESVGPATELAYHWSQAQDLPRALKASQEAGMEAERMRAPVEARRHFENAIDLWNQVPDPEEITGTTLLDLLRRAAERSYQADEPARAVEFARRALELAAPGTDQVALALLHERLGRYLWFSGHDVEGVTEHEQAVQLMPADPPSPERAWVLASLAQVLVLHGQGPRSRELAEEAIELARRTGARDAEAIALMALGTSIAEMGRRDDGIATIREALGIVRELGSPDDHRRAYQILSHLLDQDGRVEESVEVALEGAADVRELGLGRASWLLAKAAGRKLRLGRLDEAEVLAAEALDEAPTALPAAFAHESQARVALLRGRLDEAAHHLGEAQERLAPVAGALYFVPVYEALCLLSAQRDDVGEVRRLLAQAQGRMGADGGEKASAVPLYVAVPLYLAALQAEADAAERARARGDTDAEREATVSARELVTQLQDLRADAGLDGTVPPQVLVDLALVDAELTRAEGKPDPGLWVDPAERSDALGNLIAAAYARMRQAEALLDSGGDREAAAATLLSAHAVAAECGAEALRAQIELLARRARIEVGTAAPGKESEADRLGLTARELEVLALVAAGRTNREIGEELFISGKTASVHVSRILTKLGVRSRGEAGALAHRLDLVGEEPVLGA